MSENTHAPERWLPVVGYEDRYEVSDHGNVRAVARVVDDAIGRHRHLRERPLTPYYSSTARRYLVKIGPKGDERQFTVSSLVLTAFIGPRPGDMEVCHNDGDSTNDHLDNLRWDTSAANKLDIVRHGNHVQARKTHCPYGHALQVPNLLPAALRRNRRVCLACARTRTHRRYEQARGRELMPHQSYADMQYARIMKEAA